MEPSAAQVFVANAAKSMPPPPGGRYCCVVGCHNSQRQDGPRGIKFHSFPKDPDRRHEWNKAVNRALPNKQLWTAGKNDLVCSAHFVNGKKSDSKKSLSYIPTVFPTHSVQPRTQADVDRQARREARQSCSRKRGLDAPADHVAKRMRQVCKFIHHSIV